VFSSAVCRSDFFHLPLYHFWCSKIKEKPRYHRKQWEFVFIAHALYERGFLKEGSNGVGFGVGREPLADLFASYGCKITASDLAPEEAVGTGWIETDQHAYDVSSLYAGISNQQDFDNLVDFRSINMNSIPRDLLNFDFCYSSCSIEHVGSLALSKAFLKNSLGVLKVGGISIHTTELNLSSDTSTIEDGPTVMWRRSDFIDLASELLEAGHYVAPLDFYIGKDVIDEYIDFPPFSHLHHLRLQLSKYVSTSAGIIIQRRH
jgi:hypothetical protein